VSRGGQSRTRPLQGVHVAGVDMEGLVGTGGHGHVVTLSNLSGSQLQMAGGGDAAPRHAGSWMC
jgi:hypothetical protein